jgi:hypothetical protein
LHNNYNDWDNEQFNPIDHSSLVPVYQNLIDEFIRTVKFGKNYQYKWNFVNFSINTEKMTEHDHFWNFGESHNMFSCCHYISFDNNFHMPTQFINSSPINHFSQATEPFRKVLSGSEIENSIYYTKWSIDTNEDDFIIFPSYLKHEVATQKFKTDYPRVMAVLNIEIIPK